MREPLSICLEGLATFAERPRETSLVRAAACGRAALPRDGCAAAVVLFRVEAAEAVVGRGVRLLALMVLFCRFTLTLRSTFTFTSLWRGALILVLGRYPATGRA